jgi:CheY-like chemotaxis protein
MAQPPNRVVLLVEDNPETADVLRRIITLRGYKVVAAWDGLDALDMLRSGLRPAAIVLDLWMPNLDGRAFRAALLEDPELHDVPVVVYSVDAGTEAVPHIVGHVRKGTDNPDVLLGFIDAACARGARRERL